MDTDLVQKMRSQGITLAPQIIPSLEEHFGDYEVFSVEEKLYEPINAEDFKFKGFIDVVLKKDDTYHILDWKTCSWGWDQNKKRDRLVTSDYDEVSAIMSRCTAWTKSDGVAFTYDSGDHLKNVINSKAAIVPAFFEAFKRMDLS